MAIAKATLNFNFVTNFSTLTFKPEIVFVRTLLPFMAGIVIGYVFQNEKWVYPILALTSLLFMVLCCSNMFYIQLKLYHYKGINGLIYYLFCFCFGIFICLLNNQSLRKNYFAKDNSKYLKAYINNEPQLNNHTLRFQVTITEAYHQNKWFRKSGQLLVALASNNAQAQVLNYGDEILISAQNLAVEPPYNPAEFDFKAWLASKNIYHQTYIAQDHLVKLNDQKGNLILKYAIALRQKQVKIYRKLIRNDEAFAVASTLILGYRADLSSETLDAYSKTGTIHALSVSGMHVGIIYLFLNWILFFLDRNRLLKILKISLICSLIWYYALLTGLTASVLRSAVMLSVYIFAKSFNRNTNSYNILAFTAFCLLVYDPFLLWDAGFELSFLAVFGLIYLQPKIYKWIYVKNKWLDKLWSTVAISLAAQIATFPLSIYYFHQFPLYFIFSNLFILLPITALMYIGIAILILKLHFLAPIFEWLINFTNNGLKWIANLPFSGIDGIWLNGWQLLLLSIALGLLMVALSNFRKKWLFISLVLFIGLQFTFAHQKFKALNQRKLLCFSLRKNYAAAFINAKNAIVLSDLSPNDKGFRFFVKPALDQLQLKDIQFLKWEQDTLSGILSKKEHQITFYKYSILLLDSSFNYKKIEKLARFDLVWIHKSFKKKLIDLRQEIIFSDVIIDATVKDYQITSYQAEANKIGLNIHVLKKNNSYLIDFKSTRKYE